MKKRNSILSKELEKIIYQCLKDNKIKNMWDIQNMMRTLFVSVIQKLLDAEIDVKLNHQNSNIQQ